ERRDDGWMVGEDLIKGHISLDRFVAITVARQETGIGVDETQGVFVGGVGRFHSLRGLLRVIGYIGYEGGMIVPEYAEVLAPKPIDKVERSAPVTHARISPRGQERYSNVVLLAGAARSAMGTCDRELLRLYCLYAKDEVRQVISRIARQQTAGEAK